MPGRLTVCPTPIGNLADLSPRARQALSEADLVACEDTRRAGLPVRAPGHPAPAVRLQPRGQRGRARRAARAADRAGGAGGADQRRGHAGDLRPGLPADPHMRGAGLDVEVLPGPSLGDHGARRIGPAARSLALRGLPSPPRGRARAGARRAETVVAFESPRRLPASLAALAALAPDRPAAVCRELTKLHEEVARGTLAELARRFRERGEGRDRRRDRARRRRRRPRPTPRSRWTRCDAWSSRARARARPPASSPRSPGTRANDLYAALTGREPRE